MTQIVSNMPLPLGINPTEEETFSKSGAESLNTRINEGSVYCSYHRGAHKIHKEQLYVRCISVDGANCPTCREIIKERRDETAEDVRPENSTLLSDVQLELNVSRNLTESEDELSEITNKTSFCTKCREHRIKILATLVIILLIVVATVCICIFTGDKEERPRFNHHRGRGRNSTEQTTDPSIYFTLNCTTIDFKLDKSLLGEDKMYTNDDYVLPWILQKDTTSNSVQYDTQNRTMTVLYQAKYFINTHIHIDAHSWIPVTAMEKTFYALFCLHISGENPICKKTVVISKLVLPITIQTQRYLNKGQQLYTTITVSDKSIVLALHDDYDRFGITPLSC